MLRFSAPAAARNEESLGEGFRRVADDEEEWIRQAAAATEESRKAEAETREARRAADEAHWRAEAKAREARRTEDEARRAADEAHWRAEAKAREARRLEDEARRKAEAEAWEARRTEDEARRKAEVEARDARRQAEVEAREARRTEDQARRKAEAEARDARRQAEAEALEVRRAEDEARRHGEARAIEARRQEEEKVRETHRLDDLERKRRFDAMIAEGIRKRDEAFDAGSRKLEEAIHRMAGDGDPLRGQVVVALDEESLPPLLDAAGIGVDRVIRRLGTWRKGGWREWELVAAGSRVTVVIEIEPTLRMHDVRRCRSRMRTFRAWRPEFDRPEMRIYGALAYVSAKPAALRFAERRGFLLIGVDDSGAALRNSPGFEPSSF